MKSTLNTVFLVFVLNASSAQTFDLLISTPSNDFSNSAIELEDGFVISLGSGSHFGSYLNENRLLKVDKEGSVIDSLLIELPGKDVWIRGMLEYNIQNFFIYGALIDKGNQENIPFLASLNAGLEFNYFNIYDSLLYDSHIDQCIINETGNLFCIGQKFYSPYALFFCEIDFQGTIISKNTISSGLYGGHLSILELPHNDSYHIVNRYNQITQINRNNLQVDTLIVKDGWIYFLSAKAVSDSSYLIMGEISGFNSYYYESIGTVKFNYNFQKLDSINYFHPDTNDAPAKFGLDFLNPDSILIGYTKNYINGLESIYEEIFSWYGLYNVKPDGSLNWQKYYGGDCNYYLRKVLATRDGGALLIGQRWDWKNNSIKEKDVYIIKIDREGNFVPKVGIGINEQMMQAKTVLVYPNPATDKINIQTGLMRNLHFQLFDARGRLLIEKVLNSSSESIDISTLPGGVYLYKTEGKNGFYESGKIVKE